MLIPRKNTELEAELAQIGGPVIDENARKEVTSYASQALHGGIVQQGKG